MVFGVEYELWSWSVRYFPHSSVYFYSVAPTCSDIAQADHWTVDDEAYGVKPEEAFTYAYHN